MENNGEMHYYANASSLCSSLSLVVGTTFPMLCAHANKTLRTSFFCADAIRQTPSPRYAYRIPVYWPTLRSFIIPVWFRGGVPHTFPHTNSGISTGAVMSVDGELISVQAAQNHSNRGRPKTKTHDPHHPQNKQNGEEKNAVRVALYLATSKTSQTNKTLHIYNVYQALTVQEYTW